MIFIDWFMTLAIISKSENWLIKQTTLGSQYIAFVIWRPIQKRFSDVMYLYYNKKFSDFKFFR